MDQESETHLKQKEGPTTVPKKHYWDAYYAQSSFCQTLPHPSQFAAFAIQEMEGCQCVVEFGCGNGRDAFFFERYGKHVIALDACEVALAHNLQRQKNHRMHIQFLLFCVGHDACPDQLLALQDTKALYARFFLHALTQEERLHFWKISVALLNNQESLFLEYRTTHDQKRTKTTPEHFRNYLDPQQLEKELKHFGLCTHYLQEGGGFAKWQQDDAWVARHVVRLAHGKK